MTYPKLVFLLAASVCLAAGPAPLKIKVVVVAMFEPGEDTGDRPGEFQFWVEREKLTQTLPFDAGYRKLRLSADGSVLGVVTGAGVTNATSTIMALGMDPRFDFSKTYWIIAGIAGADPEDASLGSAAWANYVLDGDLVYELDAREAPADWPYSRLAVGAKRPGELPERRIPDTMVYQLNPKLVEWAYQLTKNLKLKDTPEMAAYSATYKGFPKAMAPPFVMKGDSLGSSTYWHGKILTQWANDWVKMWTGGKGNFVMTNMEDNGTATALKRLERVRKVDFNRVLFLRTASNYCMPAPEQAAAGSLLHEYAGGLPALESAYQVGSAALHEILKHWKEWEEKIPGE
jgi:purine nucleoside permease